MEKEKGKRKREKGKRSTQQYTAVYSNSLGGAGGVSTGNGEEVEVELDAYDGPPMRCFHLDVYKLFWSKLLGMAMWGLK